MVSKRRGGLRGDHRREEREDCERRQGQQQEAANEGNDLRPSGVAAIVGLGDRLISSINGHGLLLASRHPGKRGHQDHCRAKFRPLPCCS